MPRTPDKPQSGTEAAGGAAAAGGCLEEVAGVQLEAEPEGAASGSLEATAARSFFHCANCSLTERSEASEELRLWLEAALTLAALLTPLLLLLEEGSQ